MTTEPHNSSSLLEAALRYGRKGFPVLPVNGKHPLVKDWPDVATADPKQIREWWAKWPDANIGLVTGDRSGRFILDIDGTDGERSLAVLEDQHGGPLPETLEVSTGRGRHLYFQLHGLDIRNSSGDLAPGLDVRGNGGLAILPPSVHSSGKRYEFLNRNPVADPPDWLVKLLLQSTSCSRPATADENGQAQKIPEGRRNTTLTSLAGTMRRRGMSIDAIRAALWAENLQRCDPPLSDGDIDTIANSIGRYAPAEPPKTEPPRAPEPESPTEVPPRPEPQPETEAILGREDVSNSERFVNLHGDSVRFWHGRNRWLLWDGARWDEDALGRVVELAKETARNIFLECSRLPEEEARPMARWAVRSLNRDKINSMLALAESHPKIATTTENWDRDPWALNFANGTVNLCDGQLRPHSKSDFITKIVRCNFTPDLVGPRWTKFVEQTFGDLAGWMQKAVGYSLTAVTSEKVAFLLWGKTNTAKTTFLTTLAELFAGYSALLQIETLMWSKTPDNNTSADLVDLRGARLAVTSETDEGQRLREAKLKRITQGMGKIKSCRKYENPIDFAETHKLWMDCNHQPIVRGSDEGIWGRLIIIPCTHEVAEPDQDKKLKEKLLGESEAIASWVVAGALLWHKEGLGRPEMIVKTRNQWRLQMDVIGQFLSECVEEDPESSVRAGELYKAFKAWCEKEGIEHPITSTAFGLRLGERGLPKDEDRKGTFYPNLKLKGGLF
jgi:putative DNA primase/helicase